MRMTVPASVLAAGLLVPFPGAHAAGPELPSAWRAGDVVVDGRSSDWSGRLVPLAGVPLSGAVRNDGAFVYVCLRTADEATKKQILAVGLSILLDDSGKEEHGFGVRFPVGSVASERSDLPDTGDDAFSKELSLSMAGAQVLILGHEEADMALLRIGEARPIEAALGEEEGALVIELKVPLVFSVDTPHAVGARPGSVIALGLETTSPKPKRSRGAGPRDPGAYPGGPGGRGGRNFGGGPGAGPRPKAEKEIEKSYGKPLRAWFRVPLATPPAS